jgi:hypothetical protein
MDPEMQLRDVRTLIDESVDWPYLKDWPAKLGIAAKLDELESSLPLNPTRRERRLAFAKRLYAGEPPDAALLAFAEWKGLGG